MLSDALPHKFSRFPTALMKVQNMTQKKIKMEGKATTNDTTLSTQVNYATSFSHYVHLVKFYNEKNIPTIYSPYKLNTFFIDDFGLDLKKFTLYSNSHLKRFDSFFSIGTYVYNHLSFRENSQCYITRIARCLDEIVGSLHQRIFISDSDNTIREHVGPNDAS